MLYKVAQTTFSHDPYGRRISSLEAPSFLKYPLPLTVFFRSVGLSPESRSTGQKPIYVRRRTTISGVNSVSFQVICFG